MVQSATTTWIGYGHWLYRCSYWNWEVLYLQKLPALGSKSRLLTLPPEQLWYLSRYLDPGSGPSPFLEPVLLPAEVDGQEICLLLHFQSLQLDTITSTILISINAWAWELQQEGQICCRMPLGKSLLFHGVRGGTASSTMCGDNFISAGAKLRCFPSLQPNRHPQGRDVYSQAHDLGFI